MKSLRDLIRDSQKDDFEFDDDHGTRHNNNDDDDICGGGDYNDDNDEYYSNDDDDDNKVLKEKMKNSYSQTLGKSIFGKNKIKDMKKMPSIYLNAPEIRLYSKSQLNQYAPGQLSHIRFQQKHPFQMNNSKSNLELQLKYDMLQVLFDECYYSKDYNGMGLILNTIVELMPLHLPTLMKVSDLISNVNNNKTSVTTLARKSLPSQRSARINKFRNLEKSKALLVLFVELFVSNELVDDCQLFLRTQMSNPSVSANNLYLYYQTMIKLLKTVPQTDLVDILRNPMKITRSFEQSTGNGNGIGIDDFMDIEASDDASDSDSEDENVVKKSKTSATTPRKPISTTVNTDDVEASLETLALKFTDSITINSFYIASLVSKKEHKKALKYLNGMISHFKNDDDDKNNNESKYTKLLIQYYSLLLLKEKTNDLSNQFVNLSKSFFLKDRPRDSVEQHIYCAILLYKINQLPIDKVFELVCDNIVTLPTNYNSKCSSKTMYSLYQWRILSNVLGPLSAQTTLLSSIGLNQYRVSCKYWTTTILSDSDLGDCNPYPIAYETKSIHEHLITLDGNASTERMKSWHDFLTFEGSDANDLQESYLHELLIMLAGNDDESLCFSKFSKSSSIDVDASITKLSFPVYSIWNLSNAAKKKDKEKDSIKHPFFKLGQSLLEILSFQIVVSAWLSGLTCTFVIKGVQVIVQHAYLETLENDAASQPAHCCLKYLQYMNIDLLQCINKAFELGIASQDNSGVLLSMVEAKPIIISPPTTNDPTMINVVNTIPTLPQLQSCGQVNLGAN